MSNNEWIVIQCVATRTTYVRRTNDAEGKQTQLSLKSLKCVHKDSKRLFVGKIWNKENCYIVDLVRRPQNTEPWRSNLEQHPSTRKTKMTMAYNNSKISHEVLVLLTYYCTSSWSNSLHWPVNVTLSLHGRTSPIPWTLVVAKGRRY